MTAGLYNLESKKFIEISNGFMVGNSDDCDLCATGTVEPKQAQFHILETGIYLLNIDTKNDVLVNMKRLPKRFFIPLEDNSLIVIGEDSFIFSLKGVPKSFTINEVVEAYENSSPSDYDSKKLERANLIQDEIEKLNSEVPGYLKNTENIKVEINNLLAQRKTFEIKMKEIDDKINDLKIKFETNKKDINPIAVEIKRKKQQLAKILQELASEKGSSKLELDL